MLASGATSWGAWDVPAAKLSPPGPPPPGTGLLHLLTFNGATAFRRWKRPVPRCPFAAPLLPLCCPFAAPLLPLCCPFAAPLLPLCCPFAAPLLPLCCPFAAPLLPLCCPFAAPLLPLCCPFNGATAFRRWKRARLLGAHQRPHAASMGPPPFGDGNAVSGATVEEFERLLQWGHRLSAMEMTIVQAEVGRGYELQWGHRLSAMETSKSGRARNITSSGFNGATAFRRWKQRLPAASPRRQGCASMGPPPFGDGNVRWPVLDDQPGLHASMGPPPFGDGNRRPLAAPGLAPAASMGPPPFGDGNV